MNYSGSDDFAMFMAIVMIVVVPFFLMRLSLLQAQLKAMQAKADAAFFEIQKTAEAQNGLVALLIGDTREFKKDTSNLEVAARQLQLMQSTFLSAKAMHVLTENYGPELMSLFGHPNLYKFSHKDIVDFVNRIPELNAPPSMLSTIKVTYTGSNYVSHQLVLFHPGHGFEVRLPLPPRSES